MFVLVPDSCHPISALISLSCKYLLVMSSHLLYTNLIYVSAGMKMYLTYHYWPFTYALCRYFLLA